MGKLRRKISISTRLREDGAYEGRAVVEDDFHHFRVGVIVRDGHVASTYTQSPRAPTRLCPAAGSQLKLIEGMPLERASTAVHAYTDARHQCTHMFDLAGLVVAAIARRTPGRAYEAEVEDEESDKPRMARLWRDGKLVYEWELENTGRIKSPPPFSGRSLGGGYTGWARETFSEEDAEAALVLRRAVFISGGRNIDLDDPARRTGPVGGCWVFQPERMDNAIRNVGSTQDFTDRRDDLLSCDSDWLAFSG